MSVLIHGVQSGGGGGGSVNPVGRWQWEEIVNTVIPNPTASIPTTGLGDYNELLVCIESVTTTVGTGLFLRVSIDNGANYLTNIYNYIGEAGQLNAAGDIDLLVGAPAASKTCYVQFFDWNSTAPFKLAVDYVRLNATTGPYRITQASPMNALLFAPDAGNMTGGRFRILGKGKA